MPEPSRARGRAARRRREPTRMPPPAARRPPLPHPVRKPGAAESVIGVVMSVKKIAAAGAKGATFAADKENTRQR